MSQRMIPGREHFKLEKRTFDVTELLPEVRHRPDIWYVLSDIIMSSHVGTHIEFPYHHLEDGAGAAEFPLEKLIGPGLVLDFHQKKGGEAITVDEARAAARNRIRKGDMIFIRQDADKLWRTEQWDDRMLEKVPRLRRVSISPWCELEPAAQACRGRWIFSWKPNPAMVASGFDTERIRRYIRHVLEVARGCVVEMIHKDTFTVEHDRSRLETWARLAKEEVEKVHG